MTALAPTLQQLIFWRFIHGLLLPPIFAVTIAYIVDEFPPSEANGVIGIYASASAVGGFLGRFIPGMITEYVGWRGGFLALACGTVICLVAVPGAQVPPRQRLQDFMMQMLAHSPIRAACDLRVGLVYWFTSSRPHHFELPSRRPAMDRSPASADLVVICSAPSPHWDWVRRSLARPADRALCAGGVDRRDAVQPDGPSQRSCSRSSSPDLRPGASTAGPNTADRHVRRGRPYVTSFYIGGTFAVVPGLASSPAAPIR
jgi:hypothetical protein